MAERLPGVPGGQGFNSWPGLTKNFLNYGTWCFPAKCSALNGYTKEIWSFYPLLTVKCDQVGYFFNVHEIQHSGVAAWYLLHIDTVMI